MSAANNRAPSGSIVHVGFMIIVHQAIREQQTFWCQLSITECGTNISRPESITAFVVLCRVLRLSGLTLGMERVQWRRCETITPRH